MYRTRLRPPYQATSCLSQRVEELFKRLFRDGWRVPFLDCGPRFPLGLGNGSSYRAASRRNRETKVIPTLSAAQDRPSFTPTRPPSTSNTNCASGHLSPTT